VRNYGSAKTGVVFFHAKMAFQSLIKTQNVLLFIPNLIGYSRILLLMLSLATLNLQSPLISMAAYCLSGILDALDGHAARYFNQATRFGAVLDMVTDRCATSCLMVYVSLLYPSFFFVFQMLIALDFSSHYMQMVSTLSTGLQSHKTMRKDTHWLLNLYYTDRKVLFSVCLGNEMFFILLYVAGKLGFGWGVGVGFVLAFPVFVFKQICNVIQLVDASMQLVRLDEKDRKKK
jgi:CDP-diacylglycerol--inositol 3-phosphatidyltransferase